MWSHHLLTHVVLWCCGVVPYQNESYPVFRDITYKHFEPYAQDLYQHIATTKVLRSLEQEVSKPFHLVAIAKHIMHFNLLQFTVS